jgi:iron-sulfur cluster assembly accessory protein
MNDENTLINLTPAAVAAVRSFQATTKEYRSKSLRIYLAGKGCDGFSYGVCFDEAEETDTVFSQDGINLTIDQDTIKFVAGSEVDWVETPEGKGFVVQNPNHKKFRGKFFRRKNWQDRLFSNAKDSTQ